MFADTRYAWTLVREVNGDRTTEIVEAEEVVERWGALYVYDGGRTPTLIIAPGQWTRVERGPQLCSCLVGGVAVRVGGATGTCDHCKRPLPKPRHS